MKIGIVGLPLSGKSTVFNALTGLNAQVKEFASNTKVKPNLGTVKVPDDKLNSLYSGFKSRKITPISVDFVDMVGLSKDAKAEDIDLTPLRDADALVCVSRFFNNDNVPHPYGNIDGVRDLSIFNTELMLLDLKSIENRIERIQKELKKGIKTAQKELDVIEQCQKSILNEKPLRSLILSYDEEVLIRGFQFLSKKPMLALANIDEASIKDKEDDKFKDVAEDMGMLHMPLCGKVEAEIAQLDDVELKESFMNDLGIDEIAVEKFIRKSFSLLNLITFYTAGEEESRAWVIRKGSTAQEAAGKIHSDIQRGFIRAEVVSYQEIMESSCDMNIVKSKGKFQLEGKGYIVKDSDVIYFRFNV